MNIHRNVLSIVAGTLLMASLPAGAQVLGGSFGGAMNGAFGGPLGGAGVHSAAAGNAGVDASRTVGATRDRASQAAARGNDIAVGAYGEASSRVESTRGTAAASVETAHSAGMRGVRQSRRAARSAAQASTSVAETGAAQASTASNSGVLVSGASEGQVEQRALGRSVTAQGAAGSQTSADRSKIATGTYGEAGVSVQKE